MFGSIRYPMNERVVVRSLLIIAAVLVPSWKAASSEPVMSQFVLEQALSGNLQSQRRLAECYRLGCSSELAPNSVLACAWSIIVVASGAPGVVPDDTESRRRDCESLSPEDQAAATRQAKSLFQKIYGKELMLPADFFGGNRPA